MDNTTGPNNSIATAYNLGTISPYGGATANRIIADSVGEQTTDPVDYFSFTIPQGVTQISTFMRISSLNNSDFVAYSATVLGATLVSGPNGGIQATPDKQQAAGNNLTISGYTDVWNVSPGTYKVEVHTASAAINGQPLEHNYDLHIDLSSYASTQPGSGSTGSGGTGSGGTGSGGTGSGGTGSGGTGSGGTGSGGTGSGSSPGTTTNPGTTLGGGQINSGSSSYHAESVNNAGEIVGWTLGGNPVGIIVNAGKVTQYSFPGSSSTQILSVNDKGDFAGIYYDSQNKAHAFINIGGTSTTIGLPPAPTAGAYINHIEINNADQVTGDYLGSQGTTGFLYASGVVNTIKEGSLYTSIAALNDSGSYGGSYGASDGTHLFYTGPSTGSTPATGNYTLNPFNNLNSQIVSINDVGQKLGFSYINGQRHGFLIDSSLAVTHIDVPGAIDTVPTALNNKGQVAGYYFDAQKIAHAFLESDGVYTTINLPGNVSYKYDTDGVFTPIPVGINDSGQIVINSAGTSFSYGQPANSGTHIYTASASAALPSSDVNIPFSFKDSIITDGPNAVVYGPNSFIAIIPQDKTLSFTDGSVKISDGNPLVNNIYYDSHNNDVFSAQLDPDQHYAQYGWHEGRDPNAFFSTNGYLAANHDVAATGLNPLAQYDQSGWKQGRDPSANFDNELYLKNNPDVAQAGLDPLAHYLQYGQAEGRQAYAAIGKASDLAVHTGFDPEYYLLSNPDVAKAALAQGGDTFAFAYQNYQSSVGQQAGHNPNAYFDVAYYLANNPDVAAAHIDPLTHYDLYGWKEGRNPSAAFNTAAYEHANPDVAAAHIDPLQHYLQYGALEGRHLA